MKYKLSKYSKYLQQKLGLILYDFQKKYFYSLFPKHNSKHFYEEFFNCFSNITPINYKNIKEKYENYLEIYYKNIPLNIIYKIICEKVSEEIEEPKIKTKIDIYSPLFNTFMSDKTLVTRFSINIPLNDIITNNLKLDYYNKFEEMNKNNIQNYESINITFKEEKDFDIINELNLIYTKIKYISIENYSHNYLYTNFNITKLLNNNDIKNNLISLIINFKDYIIESKSFDLINNFNLLKFINFENVKFSDIFNLSIKNLNYLYLAKCENISFYTYDMISKIKGIKIINTKILNNENEIKFPLLEEAEYFDDNKGLFDYNNLINLKVLKTDAFSFLKINNSPLEYINQEKYNKGDEYNILNKIANIKTIKNAFLSLNNIDNKILRKIKEINSNLKSLVLTINGKFRDFNMNEFIKIFPSLEDFNIHQHILDDDNIKLNISTIIEENNNCKIKTIHLILKYEKIFLCLCSFSNIKELTLYNIQINTFLFPLFNKKCGITFNFLEKIDIKCGKLTLDIFENIINNLDNCPKLKYFSLFSKLYLSQDKYFSILKKLFSNNKNIKDIELILFGNRCHCYSRQDLKTIFPEINEKNYYYYYSIEIYPYKIDINNNNDNDIDKCSSIIDIK